jgi:glycosyltransferase involved in cell wall biosynthesis
MKPVVSTILPVKNGAAYIDEALRSIERALANVTHEIIVINDGSTDDTEKILKSWKKKIIVISESGIGPAASRNEGIKKAKGEFIAFIDADDVWTPDHINILKSLFDQRPEAQVAMGYTQRFTSSPDEVATGTPLNQHTPYGEPVLMPTFGCALFCSSAFQNIGEMAPNYVWHEDVDWYLRALEANIPLVITKEVVKYYRIHHNNTTHELRSNDKSMLRVLATSLERRQGKKLSSLKEFEI